MVLKRDVIESSDPSRRIGSAISSRPTLWIGGSLLALTTFAYAAAADRSPAAAAEHAAKEQELILVPDHQSAGAFAALHAPLMGNVSPAAAQEGSQTAPMLPAPPFPSDTLLVTSDVPKLAEGQVSGPPAARVMRPDDPRRAALAQFALERFRQQLSERAAAYAESSTVGSFQQQRRAQAQEASDFLNGATGDSAGAGDALSAALAGMPAALQAAAGRMGAPGAAADSPDGLQDPNAHAAKKEFMQNGGAQLPPGELEHTIARPRPYMIPMGWKIPGTLETEINSEGPGGITGRVSQDVFDVANGEHLLIPKNSLLVGTYSSRVTQGQRRVQVAWTRVNYPNGATLDLGSMPGTDQAGITGFSHTVDNHFMERLGGALLASMFTVGYEVTVPKTGLGIENSVHRGLGESITQFGINEANRVGQQPPTLKIPVGYKFNIFVTKDIRFKAPYEDGIDRSTRR